MRERLMCFNRWFTNMEPYHIIVPVLVIVFVMIILRNMLTRNKLMREGLICVLTDGSIWNNANHHHGTIVVKILI